MGGRSDLQTWHIGKSDFWTDGDGWAFTNEEYDQYVVAPVTVGGIRLWIRDFAQASYRQVLDLQRAEWLGTFIGQGTEIQTRVWAAATSNLLVIELTVARAGPAHPAVGFQVRTFARRTDANPGGATLPTFAGQVADVTWAERHTWDRGRWVARACLATRVLGVKTEAFITGTEAATASFTLHPGQTATIVTVLTGGVDAVTQREDAISAVGGYDLDRVESLRTAHHEWWESYWRRCWLDLDGDIVERYWYGALYALGCCSRPGATCPGMFGFSTDDHPRWNGDYHLNYNAEQPFQGVCAANRPELAEPYFDAITDFMPEGRRRAVGDLDRPYPGVLYPIGLGPRGIVTQDDYMAQKCAAAYAAMPFLDHFDLVRDLDLTRRVLYPYLKAVGEFWEAYLRDVGGRFEIHGSASHEHGGHDRNSIFDLPLVRRVFISLREMSETLGVDEAMRERWEQLVQRLAPYPTTDGPDGPVFKEADNAKQWTRSIALLNAIWPGGGDIHLGGDPDLLATAQRTLRALDLWDHGNTFAWVFPAAARVGLAETYERLVQRLRGPAGLRENLTVAQSFGGIETLGGIAAVHEMLLQSSDGWLRFFPCWPRNRAAAFYGLRARGAFVVDGALIGGRVTGLRIVSDAGGLLRMVNPWPGEKWAVRRSRGGAVVAEFGCASEASCVTQRGESYEVVCGDVRGVEGEHAPSVETEVSA